ncbi:hypothetical protein Tsubulata_019547 [Turnera subulata]|uniref:Cytochrome P450 n=1 Tax=Turnera subulata TaxID=218843 RepID=A0A9Q0F138_9ROSI|nr:hypothetical protein Tsubulata_019547 [Turnera subulata]
MAISAVVTEASSTVLNTFSSTPTSTTASTVAALVVTLFSIIIIFSKLQRKRDSAFKNLPLPPGPAPWPLLGCIPEFLVHKANFRWIHQLMKEMNTEIACIRLGNNTHLVPVTCPEIAREICKKNDAAFANRPPTIFTELATRLLTPVFSNDEQWKKLRRMLIAEVASSARLRWLHDKRAEEADNLVFYVHNQCKANKSVDLRLVTRFYAANVIRKITLGVRNFGKGMPDGGPGPEELEHVEAIFVVVKYIYSFSISDYLPSVLAGLDLDGQQKLVKQINRLIGKYHDPIINERIKQWKSGERKDIEDTLDIFITLKDPSTGQPFLSFEEIRYQILELFLAGLDNPSNIVEWTLGEMINRPELMKKAQEEIDRVVGKDRLVQESDIRELNFVKACARESFRLHPMSAFNIPHMSSQDTEVAGYYIPKGSQALLSRYGLGRNPKVWADPLKYDPERHMNDGDVSLLENDLRFISFSSGARGCIGGVMGTYMTVIMLARLVQCFDWSAPTSKGIDLTEPDEEPLCPAIPVVAIAKPRLPSHVYPTSN